MELGPNDERFRFQKKRVSSEETITFKGRALRLPRWSAHSSAHKVGAADARGPSKRAHHYALSLNPREAIEMSLDRCGGRVTLPAAPHRTAP